MIKQMVEEFAHNSTSAPLQVRPIERYWVYRYKYPLLERLLASSFPLLLSCFFNILVLCRHPIFNKPILKAKAPQKAFHILSYLLPALPHLDFEKFSSILQSSKSPCRPEHIRNLVRHKSASRLILA